jgi:kynurenine formamidase
MPPFPRHTQPQRLSEAQFSDLASAVSNWGRWGDDDELGTLNFIDRDTIGAATALAREGVVVHCGAPVPQVQAGHVHDGAGLHLTTAAADHWEAVNDRLTMDLHGILGLTHLDALGHVGYRGVSYNGRRIADNLTPERMTRDAIQSARGGIVGRGILVDLPAVLGRPYMEPHEIAPASVVAAAIERTGLDVRRGDILMIRTGAFARQKATGEMFGLGDAPGISIAFAEWMHAAEISLLVSDVGTDPAPSEVENVVIPWHVLTLSRMGLRLIDSADLERLAVACETRRRWEFMCLVAPLDLTGATSSPVNPLCLF